MRKQQEETRTRNKLFTQNMMKRDEATRGLLQGFAPGTYVRIELEEVLQPEKPSLVKLCFGLCSPLAPRVVVYLDDPAKIAACQLPVRRFFCIAKNSKPERTVRVTVTVWL